MDKRGENNKKSSGAWWRPAITMFLRLSAWIAVPVIIGTFVGKWLDDRYQTGPWLFLASVGAAFVISMIGLVVNTLKEFRKMEGVGKKGEDGNEREEREARSKK